jgi:transposase
VQQVAVGRAGAAAWVGVDVGKYTLAVVVNWDAEHFERPWVVKNPLEIGVVIQKLRELSQGRELVIALEPSGTYGDAFRQAASDAGLVVHRVSPKAAHDHAETFDGVPSQHDGKDAAVVAELSRIGKSRAWPYQAPSQMDQELELWVDRAETSRRILQLWAGRLEGRLGRHWPEVVQILKTQSPTLLKAVLEYGGPDGLAKDADAARKLKSYGLGYLGTERIQEVIESARRTVGVRLTDLDRQRLRDYAGEALAAREKLKRTRSQLAKLARQKPAILAMGQVVGVATACVLWAYLGDPAEYHCGAAYVKAMGLNLKERSSGVYQGRLKITKRGFAVPRFWMYLAAMRWTKREPVASWYQRKKQKDGGYGSRALIGIMRRLGLAVHAVAADGVAFEASRLFGGRTRKGRCVTTEA